MYCPTYLMANVFNIRILRGFYRYSAFHTWRRIFDFFFLVCYDKRFLCWYVYTLQMALDQWRLLRPRELIECSCAALPWLLGAVQSCCCLLFLSAEAGRVISNIHISMCFFSFKSFGIFVRKPKQSYLDVEEKLITFPVMYFLISVGGRVLCSPLLI